MEGSVIDLSKYRFNQRKKIWKRLVHVLRMENLKHR